jgi:hypothetical protein
MVGARLAALREAFGKESVSPSRIRLYFSCCSLHCFSYVGVLIGILSEEQAGKGLNLKDLEKLSKMVCFHASASKTQCAAVPLTASFHAVPTSGEQGVSQSEKGCRP